MVNSYSENIKQRKDNWIGHILHVNCLIKHVTRGNVDGAGKRTRRHKQLLDYSKEKKGYWKLKEKALDRTVYRAECGRG